MIINNTSQYNFGSYARLSTEDIIRLPKKFSFQQQVLPKETNNSSSTNASNFAKIITVTVSALLGLYIAHRNNLFSPVMKETKKILKTPDTFEKINNYVSDNFNVDTFTKFTKKFLNNFATYTTESPAVTKQAKIIAGNADDFQKLTKKVFEQLNDDKNAERLKRGLIVDMMDLYLPKIVQKLQNLKDNKMQYKNLQPEIVADLFKKDEKGATLIEDLFFKAFSGRVRNTIINNVQSATKIS